MSDDRESRIVALMPLVHAAASTLRRRYGPAFAERDDLVADGYVGAILATDRYDPERGDLKPFAYPRICGEMIEGQRRRAGRGGRKPHAHALSLDEELGDGSRRTLIDLLPDSEDAITRMIDALAVQSTMDQLPEKWATLLRERHYEGLTLQQMADRRGRTESRMCQLVKRAHVEAYHVLAA